MEELKKEHIETIVDSEITRFASDFKTRHINDLKNPEGVINKKKNNVFMAELGEEFMFYSALVRSFDSSFGNLLESLGNTIASLSYDVRNKIDSFLLDDQERLIDSIISKYDTDADHRVEPSSSHYNSQTFILPKNIDSYKRAHHTDNYFYDSLTKTHYLIELKSGGDLDKKKAPSEKRELLKEYFMLKNVIPSTEKIKIFYCAAYNKNGEGNYWYQPFVRASFADDELLIGKDYWNFVCNDPEGFEVVLNQYKISAKKLQEAIDEIKELYNNN